MSTGNTIELCEQIHELRTDAVIMEAAMRAYENMIEERDDRIEGFKAAICSQQRTIEKRGEQITILTESLDNSQRLGNMLHEEITACIITKHGRTRLGNVDNTKSLAENFATVIDLYERACMTPKQIDAANSAEVYEAEWVIERALEVLHDKVISCECGSKNWTYIG